jgi:hypothetical protein
MGFLWRSALSAFEVQFPGHCFITSIKMIDYAYRVKDKQTTFSVHRLFSFDVG